MHIYGLDYKQMSRRNASVIKYKCNGEIKFSMVKTLFQFDDHRGCSFNAAFVYDFKHTASTGMHIHIVMPLDKQELTVVDIMDFMSNCIYINFQDQKNRAYICKLPNRLETD